MPAAALSAAPMPPPISLYQAPAFVTSRSAAFHSRFSSASVPLLSPRETKGALRVPDRLEAATTSSAAFDLGGIGRRADDDEIVPGDLAAELMPWPSAMNFFSASGSWTRTRSASPRRATSSAWPVPSATTRTSMPLGFLEQRQDMREQAAIVDRGGRGEHDEFVLGARHHAVRRRATSARGSGSPSNKPSH